MEALLRNNKFFFDYFTSNHFRQCIIGVGVLISFIPLQEDVHVEAPLKAKKAFLLVTYSQ